MAIAICQTACVFEVQQQLAMLLSTLLPCLSESHEMPIVCSSMLQLLPSRHLQDDYLYHQRLQVLSVTESSACYLHPMQLCYMFAVLVIESLVDRGGLHACLFVECSAAVLMLDTRSTRCTAVSSSSQSGILTKTICYLPAVPLWPQKWMHLSVFQQSYLLATVAAAPEAPVEATQEVP